MTVNTLRRALLTRPFDPFALHLADQRVVEVPHPEFMYLPPRNERIVIVTDSKGEPETINILMIVSIKPLKSGANGRRRKET